MDSQQLRYFVAVAQRGSLLKASEAVGLSQPALSRQIANLEAQLRRRLFLRTPAGMSLTPAGATLLSRAAELLEIHDRVKHDVLNSDDQHLGVLRIGIPQSSWDRIIGAAAKAIFRAFPAVRLEIDQDSSGELRDKLSRGNLDLAILTAFVPVAGLLTQPLLTEQMFLVGPWDSDLRPDVPVSPEELSRYPLISRGGPIEPALAALRASGRIQAYHVVADCKSEEACVELICSGAGFTISSALGAHRQHEAGRLRIAPIELLQNTWTLATRDTATSSVLVETAIESIRTAMHDVLAAGDWPTAQARM